MPAMNDSRVLSCHHYKIIAVCGTLSPGYARIIKKQVGSRRVQHETKMENQSWLKKLARRWGLVMSLISALLWYCFFLPCHLA